MTNLWRKTFVECSFPPFPQINTSPTSACEKHLSNHLEWCNVFQVWSVFASCAPITPVRQLQTAPAGTLWCWLTGRRKRSSPACRPQRWRARSSATARVTSPRGTAASLTSATTRRCTYTQVQTMLLFYSDSRFSTVHCPVDSSTGPICVFPLYLASARRGARWSY